MHVRLKAVVTKGHASAVRESMGARYRKSSLSSDVTRVWSLLCRAWSWPGGRLWWRTAPPRSRCPASPCCPLSPRGQGCSPVSWGPGVTALSALLQAYGASEGAVREAGGRELAGEQRRRGGAKQSLQGNGAPPLHGGGGRMGRRCPPIPRSEAGRRVCGELEAAVPLSPRAGGPLPSSSHQELQHQVVWAPDGSGVIFTNSWQDNFARSQTERLPSPAAFPSVLPAGDLGDSGQLGPSPALLGGHTYAHPPAHVRMRTRASGLHPPRPRTPDPVR